MALYKYKAQTATGKTVSGKMQANDERELHLKLKEEGKFLLSASVAGANTRVKPLKKMQVAEFARQIGTLLGSGVSLVRALKIIADDESLSLTERNIYEELLASVRRGIPLSQAMEEQEGGFPMLLIHMFRSAEASGNMDKTAMKMAEHYTKEYRIDDKIKKALIYPKMLAVVIVIVLIVLMGYVIPQFNPLFQQMEKLPIMTEILFAISDFVKKYWIGLIIGMVIFWIALKLIFSIPKVRRVKDRLLVSVPIIGKLERIIFTARFARTLSSLYTAGIPIVTTLQIAKKTVGNLYIEEQFDEMIRQVRAGVSLHEALEEIDGFTNKLKASIRVGEETGKLDTMLVSVADNLEYESEQAITKLVALVEPVMIIIMALIVGFIMIAVIKPIYDSYETIGKGTNY